MSKRPHSEESGSSGAASTAPPQAKKLLSSYEPVKFANIRSLEEMEKKVLLLQNKKLFDNLAEKRQDILELRERIEQLEHRQTKDDELLCIINRYWNQLDEDCLLMVQRFDTDFEETDIDVSSSTESFIKQLSSWDVDEVDKKMEERVHFSKRIVSRVLSAFDKTQRRLDQLRKELADFNVNNSSDKRKENSCPEEDADKPVDSQAESDKSVQDEKKADLESVVKDLSDENNRLHNLVGSLQQKHRNANLKLQDLQDKFQQSSDKADEWKAKHDDIEYKLSESKSKLMKLDRRLLETQQAKKSLEEELAQLKGSESPEDDASSGVGSGVAKSKFNELAAELEECRELASNRLVELEKLQKSFEEKVEEVERLRSEISEIPESLIISSTPYNSLKVKFNLLYNEAVQLRSLLDESRTTINSNRHAHLRQIEEMENNEAAIQKQMRNEMLLMEDQYNQLRKEYEAMELDLKQTIAHNEQTGPINSEMRSLISTLQLHNKQLKSEVQRYKKKLKDLQIEVNKAKTDLGGVEAEMNQLREEHRCTPGVAGATESATPTTATSGSDEAGGSTEIKVEVKEEGEVCEKIKIGSPVEKDETKELRSQIKHLQDSQRELVHQLDVYKSLSKDQREKADLLKCENTLREEVSSLKKKLAAGVNADADWQQKKIKRTEDMMQQCQQKLATAKQEEDALLKEMEVTGQAFEDVQEQNSRLVQALKEKDEANLKLMTERMKATQLTKLLKDDKQILEEQAKMMQAQIEALNRALQKQEEKERLLLNNLNTLEKEAASRQQAQELYKRKAVEMQQTTEDLRMNLQKYITQLKEAQTAVQEKASAFERESFRHQRIQEELVTLRRKYERVKKIEQSHNADEVLLAEIQDYKEQLTCPTCKTNRKDAILTKCFHVFCLNCLKTRYETRNRKCPKCNATFGANDYHRIYLEN